MALSRVFPNEFMSIGEQDWFIWALLRLCLFGPESIQIESRYKFLRQNLL